MKRKTMLLIVGWGLAVCVAASAARAADGAMPSAGANVEASMQPSAGDSATTPPLAVGDKARDFTLKTLDDKTVRLSELLKTGPVVAIELRGWNGYQCPICNRQVGELLSHADEILAAGARVVLVYPGAAEGLKEYAEEFITGKTLPAGFYFVTDPDMKFTIAWGLRWNQERETGYPSTFVIDDTGIVRYARISQTHGDRATASEILKALAEKS